MGMERMEGVDVHTMHGLHMYRPQKNRIHLVYPVPAWAPVC